MHANLSARFERRLDRALFGFRKNARVVGRSPILVAMLCLGLPLAGCEKQQESQASAASDTKVQVSVFKLHPRSIAITADVPGRTVASVSADIRPQVNGILKERLFKEGSEVKEGDLLYQIDPAPYQAQFDSAVATLQKNQAAQMNAQLKVNRTGELVKRNTVSQQQYDDDFSTLQQNKASVAEPTPNVESARLNLSYTKLLAPISGRIDASVITPGALLTANQSSALATIRQLDPMNVDVIDSVTNLLKLQREVKSGKVEFSGKDVAVKLQLDDGSTYPHNGTISFVESRVSDTTATFTARARFPNPNRTLLPGMYVRARVEIGLAPNTFVVPQRAVTFDAQGQAKAFFVTSDGKVIQRPLTLVGNVGNGWRVTEGVTDGDKVVVEGNMLVRDGQEVTPIEVIVDDATGDIRPLTSSSVEGPRANEVATSSTHSTD